MVKVVSNAALARLEETLPQLSLTLAHLRDLLAGQRRAVAEGDLQAVLALTMEQEELNARMSRLEGQRQVCQASLEEQFGVQGLHAIAEAAVDDAADRSRLLEAIADLRVTVVELHQEHERCAALLSAAAEVAHQTRAYLARLSGDEQAYRPSTPLSRRVQRRSPVESTGAHRP
jgi:hypothetical protein